MDNVFYIYHASSLKRTNKILKIGKLTQKPVVLFGKFSVDIMKHCRRKNGHKSCSVQQICDWQILWNMFGCNLHNFVKWPTNASYQYSYSESILGRAL